MDSSEIPEPKMDWGSSNLPKAWLHFKDHVDFNFKLDIIYTQFLEHVQPKLNSVFKRYQFNNIVQGQLSIEDFLTTLRISAADCKFTNKKEMIRDRIVFGLTSTRICEKLIQEGDKLTLDMAIEIARTFEYAQNQMKSIENKEKDVSALQRRQMRKHQQRSQNFANLSKQQKDLHKTPDLHKKTCGQCGNNHMDSSCPAKDHQCRKCRKWNHFVSVCRSVKRSSCQKKIVQVIDGDDSDSSDENGFNIASVTRQKDEF
ncbi:uncharacterized protein LOC127848439 [Dreissena polymorpha]|uniref:uncharacterized protein LOC127848439 n=1 Tax=Dreissena polymorpha TaxID=45954 RepID=UPI0022647B67|nr:uncharacterized protein LOC127848439 [Dreissena polymorpha]